MLTPDDRSQIRREIVVAILGILIGVATTFLSKITESEYQLQRTLKVVQYDDSCDQDASGPPTTSPNEVVCTITLRASGLQEIKKIRVAVTAVGKSGKAQRPTVVPVDLKLGPNFAPPDPPPQIEASAVDPSFAAVSLSRLREPQNLVWRVRISSQEPIDIDEQIQRTASTQDPDARIEEGTAWRWKRWAPLATLAASIPLIVICLLLIAMWSFRTRKEISQQRRIVWE